MTAGTLQGVAGSTDLIKVEIVTSVMGKGVGIGQGSVSGRARVAQAAEESRTSILGKFWSPLKPMRIVWMQCAKRQESSLRRAV